MYVCMHLLVPPHHELLCSQLFKPLRSPVVQQKDVLTRFDQSFPVLGFSFICRHVLVDTLLVVHDSGFEI
jgi:hypothetical protein